MNISLTLQTLLGNFMKAKSKCLPQTTTRPCDVFAYPNNISCLYHRITQDFRQPGSDMFLCYQTPGSPKPLKMNKRKVSVLIIQTRVLQSEFTFKDSGR
jgi:hypothetical protein